MVINYENTREDYEKGYESFYKSSLLAKSIEMGFGMLIIMIIWLRKMEELFYIFKN